MGLNLWHEQDLKGERRSTDENDEEKARAWTEDEAVRLFAAPDASDKRRRAYARPLFRELHVIGFVTGMRPDGITSLRPMDVREGMHATLRSSHATRPRAQPHEPRRRPRTQQQGLRLGPLR